MRMQFVPLPAIRPLNPSSLHIFARALGMLILYSVRPLDCTCNRILSRSSGDTTVRETAPATPPARNDATTACEIWVRKACRGTCVATGVCEVDFSMMCEGSRLPGGCNCEDATGGRVGDTCAFALGMRIFSRQIYSRIGSVARVASEAGGCGEHQRKFTAPGEGPEPVREDRGSRGTGARSRRQDCC